MPKKKPFSAKQKRDQLQQKRQRKRDGAAALKDLQQFESESPEIPSDDVVVISNDTNDRRKDGATPHPKINNKKSKKEESDRYRLQFNEERQHEIEEKKKLARQPLSYVSQEELEISVKNGTEDETDIDIPKRPAWDYNMTKEEVESQEAKMFRKYFKALHKKHGTDEINYFEHNQETWRQLWRVLEISDIIVVIADTRHPVLHFPTSLYNHVSKELKKKVILVLNKVDIVPPELVVAWKRYFTESFPELKVVSFTSYPKDPELVAPKAGKVLQKRRRKKGGYVAVGQRELLQACQELYPDKDLGEWQQLINDQESRKVRGGRDGYGCSSDEDDDIHQSPDEISDVDNDNVLTLGLVGHPNVGKSTLLNGLYGRKVVSTSRTPGHTKYFQTIFLSRNVRLCDCPGLVFPARIERQLQILSGMYPIAQVREPYTSVGYLAARIPLIHLLKLRHPGLEDDPDIDSSQLQWSAWDICTAWALKRGYYTAQAGRPDVYRAANSILRLAVDGRLCLCVYPPEFVKNREQWKRDPETAVIAKLQKHFTGIKTGTETWSDDEDMKKTSTSEEGSDEEDEDNAECIPNVNMFAALALEED